MVVEALSDSKVLEAVSKVLAAADILMIHRMQVKAATSHRFKEATSN